MQSLLRLALAFLGLNPFFLGAIALGILGVGIHLQGQENLQNLMKADALLAGPPAEVAPADAAVAAAAHPFGEVTVRGQLDMTFAREIALDGKADGRVAYMVPVIAIEATSPDAIGLLIYDDKSLTDETVAAIQFGPRAEGEGAFGPILMLNGMIGGMGEFEEAIAAVFAAEGRTLPAEAFALREFRGDRAGAYDPSWPFETSIFGVFAWVAGALGLYALIRSSVHVRRRSAVEAATPDDADHITEADEEILGSVRTSTNPV